MKLNHVAFIFFGPELNPKVHRTEIKTSKFTLTSVGVNTNNWEQAIDTAKELVANVACSSLNYAADLVQQALPKFLRGWIIKYL